jgi:uncharacterized protein
MKGKLVIMKPVSIACNGKCDYCYNLSVNFRTRRAIPKMSVETVERVERGLIEIGMERIRLVWHGGEPLLRGLPFYKAVMEQQARIRAEYPALRLENGMQSNLTRLTPEWCEFLKANHIMVGSSLDGWQEVHDAHRKYPDGTGMFNDAIRGMELASKYGILGGIIAVVTDVTVMQDPAKFFDYLVSVCPRAEITPCWDVGSDGEKPAYTVESQAFLDFTTAMFDHYWKLDDPQRRMRMFHGFIQGLLGGKELTCSFKGNCGDFLSVEADGSIYPCGKFSGVPEFYLGNINEQPLSEILENPVYEAWLNQRSCIPQKCQGCKFAQACNNGCTYERYQGNGQFAELSPYCDVWYGLYEHIGGRITELQTALEAQKA